MTIPVLQTKLFVPPVTPELVSRPRLIQRLEAGRHRKLTLVSAPAGFGKTTLLTEWAHVDQQVSRIRDFFGWFSLDKDDNDPARFWTYVVTAIQTIFPDIGQSALDMIQTPQPPPLESILTSLINDISTREQHFVLIIDDYHMIESDAIGRAMAFVLEHMPLQMHLVIASRVDPPLPVALLRGRGQLNEFNSTDLRFTFDEAESFFNEVMNLGLSESGVRVLENRTEGWVASLQMAAISMRGNNDIPRFIDSFSGSQRYVLDYLLEEVLYRQTKDVQSFLLETSILDSFTAPLCDAVTQRDDAAKALDYLEAANLFLVPLDDERKWFRYHSLFADLLRNQFIRLFPDLPPLLHQRASRWFEKEELITQAISHALAAGDLQRAANLIERVAIPMITIGSKVSTVLGWLSSLPTELIITRPWLCVVLASARIADGRLDDVEPLLKAAEESLSTSQENDAETAVDRASIHRAILALRASASTLGDIDIQRNLQLLREAFAQLPDDETFTRSPIALNLGVVHAMKGEMNMASQYLNEAITLAQATGNPYVALIGMGCLAETRARMGLLHEAAETCRQSLRLGAEWSDSSEPLSATGYAHISLAQIHYQWNELDEALEHLIRGIQLSEQCGSALFAQYFYPGLALMEELQKKMESTSVLGDLSRRIERSPHKALLSRSLDAWQARLSLAHGDIAATQRWIDDHEIEQMHSPPELWQEFSVLTLVRLRIALGRSDTILDLLEEMRCKAESEGRMSSAIEILVLQSLAEKSLGKADRAVTILTKALRIAEPEGFIRIFTDEGEQMRQLLATAALRGVFPVYIEMLLQSFSEIIKRSETTRDDRIEPLVSLSARELQVLRMMATGAASKEIAGTLFISIGTVNKHITNIYKKLDAHKRTIAVNKARKLGLL